MTVKKPVLATVFAAGALFAAPIAGADDATTQTIGQPGELVNGNVVQTWTISGLKPSSDAIPHSPAGTLWEATATNQAVSGSVIPIVSNFNARAADGTDYRALFQVATPQGVNPSALAQGQETTGKIYFDVTGASPDEVVYNDGGADLLVWVKPAPAPSGGGTDSSAPAATGSAQTPAATETESDAESAAASDAEGAAAEEGSQGTPLSEDEAAAAPSGSQGTPIAEGTEAAEGTGTEPAESGTGTSPTPTPDPAGSQGTPISESTENAEVPAGTPHGPQQPASQPAETAPTGTQHGPTS